MSVDALLTDHHAIVCQLKLPNPRPVQKQITYRKYCSINNIKFAQDLATSPLLTAVGDTQTLCEQYNSELSVIIDNHAPLIRRTVNVRARQPWRTNEVLRTRRQVRQAERKWRHTRLHVHRQIYTDLRDAFKKTIAHAKSTYYCGDRFIFQRLKADVRGRQGPDGLLQKAIATENRQLPGRIVGTLLRHTSRERSLDSVSIK